jgi:HNH endonuclease
MVTFAADVLRARLLERVELSLFCWEFTGWRNARGYGKLSVGGRSFWAHRLAYEVFIGPIPPRMTVDHVCANTACVNPDHLALCSRGENTHRATVRSNRRADSCIRVGDAVLLEPRGRAQP